MDFTPILNTLMSPNGIIAFLILIAPGFIAIRVMELRVPGERRNAGDAVIDIVLFSVLTDIIWGLALSALGAGPLTRWPLWLQVVGLVGIVFVTPTAAALLYLKFRKWLARPGGAIDLNPKPWDWAFNEYFTEAVQIVMTLSDGRRIGGLWQKPCFASSYPAAEQIFLSEIFSIDESTGQLVEKIPHHRGILVDKATVDFVEFFDYGRPFARTEGSICTAPECMSLWAILSRANPLRRR